MPTNTTPGASLRALRLRANLTIAQVAALAPCGAAYLSQVECGKKRPSNEFLGKITAALADELKTAA